VTDRRPAPDALGCGVLLAGLALLACACAEKVPGRVLAAGPARALVAAPDGRVVAFLLNASHPDDSGVPQDLYLGDLWLSRDGEAARQIGGAVPSAEGAVAFDRQGGALAYLASYSFRAGEGELWVVTAAEAPRRLGEKVAAFAWSPKGGRIAFVAGGALHVARAAGGPEVANAVEGIQSFAWSPDGTRLAARGPGTAGGRLLLAGEEGGAPVEVAQASSDFAFAPDGALGVLGPAPKKGGDRPLTIIEPGSLHRLSLGRATAFSFSPQGDELALLSTEKVPGESFGDLSRRSRAPGSAPPPLGSKVSEFRWSPDGDLVYLARYDLRARAGALLVAPPGGGAPRELSPRVQSFSVQGRRLFYRVQAPQKTDFKVELWAADLAAPTASAQAAPRKVDEGVYGYQLSPDGRTLYWKSRCAGLRSCALFRGPADGWGPPVQLAAAVAGFDLSVDGSRLLVGQPHPGSTRTLDLRVLDARGPAQDTSRPPIATEVEPGARFLDEGGHQLVAVLSRPRAAVVRIDVP
jgi:dipeptidyl aminopeptidase/acylaminoacyl peptidase